MDTDEEIRVRQIRNVILANEPDNEYEFKLSEESYNQLRTEFVKDGDDNAYPRLLYDWTLQLFSSNAILSSIYNSVTSIMQREQIQLGSDETLETIHSPTILVDTGHSSYEMDPDGAIFFETVDSRDYKVVIEAGVSQAYDSLLDKARKWITDNTCDLVFLLAFNEMHRYSAPRQRIFLSPHESKAQIVQMRRHLRSPSYPKFRALEFLGHIWFHELSDAFIEVVRKAPSSDARDDFMRRKYVLVEEGIDKSSSVPRSVGDVRLAELIPAISHYNEEAGNIIIDFFDSVTFMDIIWRAMISTAVHRFKRAVKVSQ
ncbi:hypothetical protein POJ06DRAFT_297654 [Lipomyces tetrasporus]|uniref:Uncharacterized protein n=1 Tax=Lipomyces tetrasporus TaxID=54092 RepID=A0AAD7VNT4_9ASCO|nr:uncharacterized protein POJ06DRAFT_297654 [Lipomyces tetrasporus]KAJ8096667.1 hypothetical protein POJ06DRAFT_297654 [Lipomyces tetrasporus]